MGSSTFPVVERSVCSLDERLGPPGPRGRCTCEASGNQRVSKIASSSSTYLVCLCIVYDGGRALIFLLLRW